MLYCFVNLFNDTYENDWTLNLYWMFVFPFVSTPISCKPLSVRVPFCFNINQLEASQCSCSLLFQHQSAGSLWVFVFPFVSTSSSWKPLSVRVPFCFNTNQLEASQCSCSFLFQHQSAGSLSDQDNQLQELKLSVKF